MALTAVAAYGMVSSAMDLSTIQPVWTYRGFFQQIVFWTWRLWTEAHGWRRSGDLLGVTHSIQALNAFAHFYAQAVFLVCPLLGFLAFSLAARMRTNWNWWKPRAIAVALATPLGEIVRYPLLSADLTEPVAEVARAVVAVILMAWSIGLIRTLRWPFKSHPA